MPHASLALPQPSLASLAARLDRVRPWHVLVPLVGAQWVALAALALTVRHNGWLYYQGGDQTFYWTTTWVLAHGHLPQTAIGYGWSFLLVPFAWLTGVNVVTALPAIVLVQTLVLLPVSLLCVYAIGARVGGRLIGYLAAALWVAGPYAAIPFFDPRYHERYVEQFLPQALGLTGLGDFPGMVCALVAAALALRALDTRARSDALLAGLALGFAIGVKPSNALLVPAPALALLLARRWRTAAEIAVGAVPALLALAAWKVRGLGHLPIAAVDPGLAAVALQVPLGSIGSYFRILHWSTLNTNYIDLREYFWPLRTLEWLPLAGLAGMLRRAPLAGVFTAAWFASFLLIKGSADQATVASGSFFRFTMPAAPALVLLVASIPLVVPTAGPAIAGRFPAVRRPLPRPRALLGVVVAITALVPLVLSLALPPLERASAAKYFPGHLYLPVSSAFRLRATPLGGGRVRLSWRALPSANARLFYTVFRVRVGVNQMGPAGVACLPLPHGAPANCFFQVDQVAAVHATSLVDQPGPGLWSYRVGAAGNWLDDPTKGDTFVMSEHALAQVR